MISYAPSLRSRDIQPGDLIEYGHGPTLVFGANDDLLVGMELKAKKMIKLNPRGEGVLLSEDKVPDWAWAALAKWRLTQ